jgi:hypothetical protein
MELNVNDKMKVLKLQELSEVNGGAKGGNHVDAWSTASGTCGGVTSNEWSTVSGTCRTPVKPVKQ